MGLKIARLATGEIKICNPKILTKLLKDKGLDGSNSTSVPYVINVDLSKSKETEETVGKKAYMKDVGTLRFIADTTYLGIVYIVGVLGRHLKDLCQRHVDALKPILKHHSERVNDGLVYENKGPLDLVGYTDSHYAADKDKRKSVSGCIMKANNMPILWISSLQYTVSHISTEIEHIMMCAAAQTPGKE